MNETLRASIIVPMYQDRSSIGACVQSLLAQTIAQHLEIIVVDDGSRDGGAEVAGRFPITVLSQANAGPGAARNRGASAATAPVLMFLDADCTVAPDWAERVLTYFEDATTSAVLCPLSAATSGVVPALVQSEIDERYQRISAQGTKLDFLASAACAVRREVFLAVGGFNPAFRANEDVELAFKLDAAGHTIRFARDARACHAHQTRFRDLLRAKFQRGLWRIRLYRMYPEKRRADAWTPATLKLQILAALALPPLLAAALLFPSLGWVACIVLAVLIFSGWDLLTSTAAALRPHAGWTAYPWALIWLVARAFVLAASVIWATVIPWQAPPRDRRQTATAMARVTGCILIVLTGMAPYAGAQEARVTIGPQMGGRPSAALGSGGGVWRVPRVQPEVGDILLKSARPGTIRAALAWEVLAASSSLEDLRVRLAQYRLNDFLVGMHRRGAPIIVTLDAMPRWLAADKSEAKRPDGPAWAKSRPADLEQWAKAVSVIVGHFSNTLGLDPYYEVWNEPDWSYPGRVPGYLELYAATVRGARSVRPNARMAGPSVSNWVSAATAEGQGNWLREFIRAAGREKLPIDALTWHVFYAAPTLYYRHAAPTIRRWLAEAGYGAGTALIVDEWNIAAEPPYPEGDLNGTFTGAAYAAQSVIEMVNNGVAAQAYQMIVDPGAPGYSAGMFNPSGVPRPSFHAFRLLGLLDGERLALHSTHPYVVGMAFATGQEIRLLLAVMHPTDTMLFRSSFDRLIDQHLDAGLLLARSNPQAIANHLGKGGPEPAIPAAARAGYELGARTFKAARAERDRWKGEFDIQVELQAPLTSAAVTHYEVIDQRTAIEPARIDGLSKELQASALTGLAAARGDLTRAGVPDAVTKRWAEMFASGRELDTAWAPAETRASLEKAARTVRSPFSRLQAEIVASEVKRPASAPPRLDGGTLRLRTRQQALHYLVLRRPQ